MKGTQGSKMVRPILLGGWDAEDIVFAEREALPARAVAAALEGVSQRMLTRTLRNLESTGLIDRLVTKSKAIAVEYSLTRRGRALITPLKGMCRWPKRHRRNVSAEMHLAQRRHDEHKQRAG